MRLVGFTERHGDERGADDGHIASDVKGEIEIVPDEADKEQQLKDGHDGEHVYGAKLPDVATQYQPAQIPHQQTVLEIT